MAASDLPKMPRCEHEHERDRASWKLRNQQQAGRSRAASARYDFGSAGGGCATGEPDALKDASSSGSPSLALSSVSLPQAGQFVCQTPLVNSGTLVGITAAQLGQTIGTCI
jgi:hypothetical protein